MDNSSFEQFGMTKVESQVYSNLFLLRETKIGELIKKTGLHRGTVFNALNDLIGKGFVSFKNIDGVRYYALSPLKVFEEKIIQKQDEISSLKKHLRQIQEDNLFNSHSLTNKPSVKVLSGKDGFKSFFSELFELVSTSKEEYLFFGKGNETIEHLGLDYYIRTQDLKRKLGIKTRAILSSESKNKPVSKYAHAEIRYLPFKYNSPMYTWIFKNKVVIVMWDTNPILTTIIESEEVANGYRNIFESLWSVIEQNQAEYNPRHFFNYYKFFQNAKDSIDILDICCMEPLHEGREKIIELLKSGKKIRILISKTNSNNFKRRVKLEENFLKNLEESRILYELKSAKANLKDIIARVPGNGLEVREFDLPPNHCIIILNSNLIFYNRYGKSKGEYGSAEKGRVFLKKEDKEFLIAEKVFESYWKNAKPVNLN